MNRTTLESTQPSSAPPKQPIHPSDALDDAAAGAAHAVPGGGRRSTSFDRWLARKALVAVGDPAINMVLRDGRTVTTSAAEPVAGIIFRDRGALLRIMISPTYQFGEMYSSGRIDISGNLIDLLSEVDRAMRQSCTHRSLQRRLARWSQVLRRNTIHRSRDCIHRHYDIGNAFYRLWLDERMAYTCAYFENEQQTLEQAQVAKFDHVCRKLRLRPGETVVEAGCGWGGLALHMAQHYGVSVRAYNISHEQIVYAREQAQRQGLADRVEFVEDDWRTISGQYDVFASVGMLEHVGVRNYRQLGDVIDGCLKPHGRALIHTIGRNRPEAFNTWIEQRIFPGAYPPALREMAAIFEPRDFSILDVENIRLHYARTLRHWLWRFEQSADQVRYMFDEQFVRMWRLYLAGSVAAFESGWLQLFQIVFARGDDNTIPWTRHYMYPQGETAAAPSTNA